MKKAIKLKLQKTIKVKPTKPFAFDPTFHNQTISLQEIIIGSRAFVGKLGIGKENASVLNFQTKELLKIRLLKSKFLRKISYRKILLIR